MGIENCIAKKIKPTKILFVEAFLGSSRLQLIKKASNKIHKKIIFYPAHLTYIDDIKFHESPEYVICFHEVEDSDIREDPTSLIPFSVRLYFNSNPLIIAMNLNSKFYKTTKESLENFLNKFSIPYDCITIPKDRFSQLYL